MNTPIEKFRNKIWDFYSTNKRNFPWREATDPYHILVSEVMLQQTQTSRVVEKYVSFLTSFPTVSRLAKASPREVLMHWQGLGYNRRALYLKRTAEIICEKYSCTVPRLKTELITLPGIGINTAGAVMAFAYNIPVVFIETNIRRVFIHEFFREKEKVNDKDLYPLIETSLDRENPKEWYYALMDYGVHLAKKETNPNRKSHHYKRQSKFEGSLRQVRGRILKLLLENSTTPSILSQQFENQELYKTALTQLISEGFAQEKNGQITISS